MALCRLYPRSEEARSGAFDLQLRTTVRHLAECRWRTAPGFAIARAVYGLIDNPRCLSAAIVLPTGILLILRFTGAPIVITANTAKKRKASGTTAARTPKLSAEDRQHLAEFDERREILRLRVEAVAKRAQNGRQFMVRPDLARRRLPAKPSPSCDESPSSETGTSQHVAYSK